MNDDESIDASAESPKCPRCGQILAKMLFLAVQPDGYVCGRCRVWLTDELQVIAHVF